jgi:hypothetical protein
VNSDLGLCSAETVQAASATTHGQRLPDIGMDVDGMFLLGLCDARRGAYWPAPAIAN